MNNSTAIVTLVVLLRGLSRTLWCAVMPASADYFRLKIFTISISSRYPSKKSGKRNVCTFGMKPVQKWSTATATDIAASAEKNLFGIHERPCSGFSVPRLR
jgi:hypothetical protein